MQTGGTIRKNVKNIENDHREYVNSGIKHSENIVIEESEIDYDRSKQPRVFYSIISYPIRMNIKDIKNIVRKAIKWLL